MSTNRIKIECEDVIKTYNDMISADMDANMLTLLSAHHLAPTIRWRNKLDICRDYIQGNTLLEYLHAYDKGMIGKTQIEDIFSRLLKWIEAFQQVTYQAFEKFIKLTDFHLGNFIDGEQGIVGIDFETYEVGAREDNFIAALAWLSLYDFDSKLRLKELKGYVEKCLESYMDCSHLEQQVKLFCDTRLMKRKTYRQCKKMSCVILSGGQNTRMGTYKSELRVGQYSFMDHLLYQNSMFKETVLSVNQTALYKKYHHPMILDCTKQIGPMGGIYSVLKKLKTDRFFLCTCDSPYINPEVYDILLEEETKEYDGIVACINGKINPLLAVYRKEIIQDVEALIKDKNYKMMCLLNKLQIKYVEVGHLMPEEVINFNTPQSYEVFSKQALKYKKLFALATKWEKE